MTIRQNYVAALSEYRTRLEQEASLAENRLIEFLRSEGSEGSENDEVELVVRLDHDHWMDFDEQAFGALPFEILQHLLIQNSALREFPQATLEGRGIGQMEWVGWTRNSGKAVSYLRLCVGRRIRFVPLFP